MRTGAVIVHYGDQEATDRCRKCAEADAGITSVIVVDAERRGRGYADSCNWGARQLVYRLSVDALVFLNNDTHWTPPIMADLTWGLRTWDVVCPVVVGVDGGIIYAGGKIDASGARVSRVLPSPDKRTQWPGTTATGWPTRYAYGCCVAMLAKTWVDIPWVSNYFLYYEDVDLSLRARAVGAKLGVMNVQLVHQHKWED